MSKMADITPKQVLTLAAKYIGYKEKARYTTTLQASGNRKEPHNANN